jgi:hypothetical protein
LRGLGRLRELGRIFFWVLVGN